MRAAAALPAALVVGLLGACGGGEDVDEAARSEAIAAAQAAYEKARLEGLDLSDGPCLGVVAPNWVADVAHDPREPVDDDPANQCPEFRSGEAEHFVELDPDGDVIRAR